MKVLITGAAGFIGYHVAKALLSNGAEIIAFDNVNAYYDITLKKARLEELRDIGGSRFKFHHVNIAAHATLEEILSNGLAEIDYVIHLAAQAGVRYSITHPFSYAESNLHGQLSMLELCRKMPKLKHFVTASSSSVYGDNARLPFSVKEPVKEPISLYAATKIADEMMSHSYSHLYQMPTSCLRFFTVYGPWGRPDMAYFLFTDAIHEGRPIQLFNDGNMRRDFTYIDDIVDGIIACLNTPPKTTPPFAVYNLGNHSSVPIKGLIKEIEKALSKKAKIKNMPMQAGDVKETFADISESKEAFGFTPKVSIEEGIPRFVSWYKNWKAR